MPSEFTPTQVHEALLTAMGWSGPPVRLPDRPHVLPGHRRGRSRPVCLAGRRACPPEDVGGPRGYADFLDAITDPKLERHAELLEWIGGGFDPEAFDPAEVDQIFATVSDPSS